MYSPSSPELLKRATADGATSPAIESELNEALAYEDSPEELQEVVAFTRIMLSFLTFDSTRGPDPAFDHS